MVEALAGVFSPEAFLLGWQMASLLCASCIFLLYLPLCGLKFQLLVRPDTIQTESGLPCLTVVNLNYSSKSLLSKCSHIPGIAYKGTSRKQWRME